jgi:ribokinase
MNPEGSRKDRETSHEIPNQAKNLNIVVVGSLHMDLTIKAKTIPRLGETVLGDHFKMSPGGKGANQAVAAAKLGANVTLIGRVGSETFGTDLKKNAGQNRINTKFIVQDKEAQTGLALIMVDQKGNNIIAVFPGADLMCSKEDIDRADSIIESADILLAQLETPFPVVQHAIQKAFQYGVKVILNPSPAQMLPKDVLRKVYVLTPNESEAEILSGTSITDLSSARKAIKEILKKGAENVVLTMGKEGALVGKKGEIVHVKSPKVNPVDTTGAGDAFCGALAVAISSGENLEEAVVYANCAGALATTKMGAQEALPTREELERFMTEKGLV